MTEPDSPSQLISIVTDQSSVSEHLEYIIKSEGYPIHQVFNPNQISFDEFQNQVGTCALWLIEIRDQNQWQDWWSHFTHLDSSNILFGDAQEPADRGTEEFIGWRRRFITKIRMMLGTPNVSGGIAGNLADMLGLSDVDEIESLVESDIQNEAHNETVHSDSPIMAEVELSDPAQEVLGEADSSSESLLPEDSPTSEINVDSNGSDIIDLSDAPQDDSISDSTLEMDFDLDDTVESAPLGDDELDLDLDLDADLDLNDSVNLDQDLEIEEALDVESASETDVPVESLDIEANAESNEGTGPILELSLDPIDDLDMSIDDDVSADADTSPQSDSPPEPDNESKSDDLAIPEKPKPKLALTLDLDLPPERVVAPQPVMDFVKQPEVEASESNPEAAPAIESTTEERQTEEHLSDEIPTEESQADEIHSGELQDEGIQADEILEEEIQSEDASSDDISEEQEDSQNNLEVTLDLGLGESDLSDAVETNTGDAELSEMVSDTSHVDLSMDFDLGEALSDGETDDSLDSILSDDFLSADAVDDESPLFDTALEITDSGTSEEDLSELADLSVDGIQDDLSVEPAMDLSLESPSGLGESVVTNEGESTAVDENSVQSNEALELDVQMDVISSDDAATESVEVDEMAIPSEDDVLELSLDSDLEPDDTDPLLEQNELITADPGSIDDSISEPMGETDVIADLELDAEFEKELVDTLEIDAELADETDLDDEFEKELEAEPDFDLDGEEEPELDAELDDVADIEPEDEVEEDLEFDKALEDEMDLVVPMDDVVKAADGDVEEPDIGLIPTIDDVVADPQDQDAMAFERTILEASSNGFTSAPGPVEKSQEAPTYQPPVPTVHTRKTIRPPMVSQQTYGEYAIWFIAASFGGPMALKEFLKAFDSNVPIAFVLVQHIEQRFLDTLVEVLEQSTSMKLKVAVSGDKITPGTIMIMPVESALGLSAEGTFFQSHAPWSGPYDPSADQVMDSMLCLKHRPEGALVFTGMGSDGQISAVNWVEQGIPVWVQDPETCDAASMPEAILDLNLASFVGRPSAMAERLNTYMAARKPNEAGI